MEIWNSDPLNEFASKLAIVLSENEELPKKTNGLEIARDEDFKIQMIAHSHARDRPEGRKIALGLVYRLENSVEISGYTGSGMIRGFSQTSAITKAMSPNQDTATTTTYSVAAIEYTFSKSAIDYTIDQIANLPEHYHWTDICESKQSGEHEINFPGDPPIAIKTKLPSTENFTRSCARFNFGSHTVIISSIKNSYIPQSKRPGYIYYSGNPGKATREKIRASLSFAFGSPLIYFGSKFFKEQGGIVGFESVTPSTFGGRAWDIVSQPFSPITTNRSNILDNALLRKAALGFYKHYEPLNLQNFIFRLWHAEVSPPYMKPAYYGAMIETIQNREIGKADSTISHTIIEKAKYRASIKLLSRFLQKQEISPDAKELLLQKIQSGNMAPQRILAERFYKTLGLSLGILEKRAWDKRNNAAHGKEEADDSVIESIRSTKILRIILGRIVISLIDGSDKYIDYYTLGHPERNLRDSIPEKG